MNGTYQLTAKKFPAVLKIAVSARKMRESSERNWVAYVFLQAGEQRKPCGRIGMQCGSYKQQALIHSWAKDKTISFEQEHSRARVNRKREANIFRSLKVTVRKDEHNFDAGLNRSRIVFAKKATSVSSVFQNRKSDLYRSKAFKGIFVVYSIYSVHVDEKSGIRIDLIKSNKNMPNMNEQWKKYTKKSKWLTAI